MLQTIPFRVREGVPLIPLADEPLMLLHYDTSFQTEKLEVRVKTICNKWLKGFKVNMMLVPRRCGWDVT